MIHKEHEDIKILYVEDDEMVREYVELMLKRRYTEVYCAADGKRGIELYQTKNIDVVITDIRMPRMNGLEMSKKIIEMNPAAHIIVTTAFNDSELLLESIDIGVERYILKPVEMPKLFDALNYCTKLIKLQRSEKKYLIEIENKSRNLEKANIELKIKDNAIKTAVSSIAFAEIGGRIFYVNDSLVKTLEYDNKDEVYGKYPEDFYPSEEIEKFQKVLEIIKTTGCWTGELKAKKKNGKLIDIRISASLVKNESGNSICMMFSFEDISERKRAETEILKLNRIYAVLSNINQSIVRNRKTGKLFNEACRIIVEYGKFMMAWIGTITPQTNKLEVTASFGIPADYLKKINNGITGELIDYNNAEITMETGKHKITNNIINYGYKSCAAFPIIVFGKVTGVLNVFSEEINFFEEDNVKLFDEVTSDLSFAVEFIQRESERKCAEEKLFHQNEFLNTILDSLVYPFYVVDAKNYNIVLANKSSGFDSMPGSTCYELTHKQNSPCNNIKHPCPLEIVKNTGKPVEVEHIHRDNNGCSKSVMIYAFPLFDKSGTVVQVIEYAIDITELKKTAAALFASEERYRLLFDNARDGIALAESDTGIIIDCNKALCNIVERDKTEILGQSQSILHPPQQVLQSGISVSFEQHRTGGNNSNTLEDFVLTKTGKHVPVEIRAAHISINGRSHLLGIFRDITERKEAEKILKDSEEKFRTTVEILNVGIFRNTGEIPGKFLFCNNKLAELHGFDSIEEFLKMPITDLYYVPSDRVAFLEKLNKKGFLKNYELILKKKNGDAFYCSCTAKIKYDNNGKILWIDGVIEDITEHKNIEKEVQNQQMQLIQSGKMAALGQLIAGVAHEINNPNCLITLNVALLEDYWKYLKPMVKDCNKLSDNTGMIKTNKVITDMERVISTLNMGSNRIKLIVDNLKNFSRDSGDAKKEYFSVKEIIEKSYLICGAAVRKRVSHITFDIPDNLPLLFCDLVKIEQVFINLMTNAADAINDQINGKIIISCNLVENKNIEIHITDNGTGIPADNINKIFDPFFTTKLNSGGTGLGLSIVWGIVKDHNGEISVNSKEGKGTEFVIKLPIKKD
ncbi:PAS domain S-box protein [Candidatus Dependentiae bacterium]|nr:PAS domain S-box protein [Candidatus Dependentiae bacterium]